MRRGFHRSILGNVRAILAGVVTTAIATGVAHAQTSNGQTPLPGAPAAVTAFVDVAVIPMDTERVLPHQTVLVEHGRIIALGPKDQVRIPDGAFQISGGGSYLMPGLADMHAHVGLEFDRDSDSATKARLVERDLFLYVANGVTTIRNADYGGDKLLGIIFASSAEALLLQARTRAATGELLSPRIYTSGEWRRNREWTIAQNLAAYRAAGYDFIKIHRDEQGELLDSLAAAARDLGLPLMGHVQDSVPHALAVGYASIEHLTGYPGGGTQASAAAFADTMRIPELVAATQRAGAWNTPTQGLYEFKGGDVPPKATLPESQFDRLDTAKQSPAKPSSEDVLWIKFRRRLIKALQDAGAGLLLGTDAPLVVPGFGVHRELQALVRAGLTPYQALVTGTRNVAAYFGTLDETGTVAVGKRADLVLLKGNPLADIQQTMEPMGVMINGRWLPREAIDQRLATYAAQP